MKILFYQNGKYRFQYSVINHNKVSVFIFQALMLQCKEQLTKLSLHEPNQNEKGFQFFLETLFILFLDELWS